MPQYPVPGGGGASEDHPYYSNPKKYGEYQFIQLDEIIDNFTATYVGEGKILGKTLKADVNYHAHRALQELHYDTLTSCKSQEIILPPSLTMRLPKDYVNYTKITWSDENGIEHVIYPTSKTSRGNKIQQGEDGQYLMMGHTQNSSKWMHLAEDHLSTYTTSTIPHISPRFHRFAGGLVNDSYGPHLISYIMEEGFAFGIPGGYAGSTFGPVPTDDSPFRVGMEIINKAFPVGTTITEVEHVTNADTTTSVKITTSNKTAAFNPAWGTNSNNLWFQAVDNTSDTTWGKYKSSGSNQVDVDSPTTTDLSVDADNYFQNTGGRYGIDPQYAQANGSFFIDCAMGLIHFSSNLNGKTIILHYLSDGHGTNGELIVHKFAEEAMYKWIAYGCLSARADTPEGVIQRFKKEKFAETRKAKIRLSNIKIEEITQLMRGKSKIIKH